MTRRAKLLAVAESYESAGQSLAARLRRFSAEGNSGIENFVNQAYDELQGAKSNVADEVTALRDAIDAAIDALSAV